MYLDFSQRSSHWNAHEELGARHRLFFPVFSFFLVLPSEDTVNTPEVWNTRDASFLIPDQGPVLPAVSHGSKRRQVALEGNGLCETFCGKAEFLSQMSWDS